MYHRSVDCTIRLDRLAERPVALSGPLPSDAEFWSVPGLRLRGDPVLDATATASGDGGVHVTGSLRATVELECRRCLRSIETTLPLPLDLWFEPRVEAGKEEEGVFGLEPVSNELDLRDALREELLLAVPEFPLCRDDCRGLCPRCGANLNDSPCGCREERGDPRWMRLKELMRQD
ncbi:MAG: DUF177 domain-containing protein [Gemmatimonadota bacterium]